MDRNDHELSPWPWRAFCIASIIYGGSLLLCKAICTMKKMNSHIGFGSHSTVIRNPDLLVACQLTYRKPLFDALSFYSIQASAFISGSTKEGGPLPCSAIHVVHTTRRYEVIAILHMILMTKVRSQRCNSYDSYYCITH